MIRIYSNGEKRTYGIKHFNLDLKSDLDVLKSKPLTPGCTAFIIENSEYYMLNGQKQWVKINPYCINGSSTGDNNTSDDDDIIYDGGEVIPGDDIIYDGGII